MGVIGASKLMQALARDKLFPGFSVFGKGLKKSDEPVAAIFLTYFIAQLALFADLDQLASLISIFYMVCVQKLANSTSFSSYMAIWRKRGSGNWTCLPFQCNASAFQAYRMSKYEPTISTGGNLTDGKFQ